MRAYRRYFPGQLAPSFNITCGKCKGHTVDTIGDPEHGDARTLAAARRALEAHGWATTRAWGLICPRCVREEQ